MHLHVRRTRNTLEKMRGLIAAEKAEILMLETRFGIHTFGLRFPIDILILDKKNRVQVMRERFKPNGIFLWNPKFSTVIELPAGFIQEKKIEKGEEITFSFR